MAYKFGLLYKVDTCYRPQTKFAKVMFLQVSACMVAPGGHAWLLLGRGSRGCSWGGMLLWGGCAWLLPGGCVWLLLGGMRGCYAWLLGGHGCSQGGMCVAPGGFFFDEIRSMSGRYASYWNAFLFINGP